MSSLFRKHLQELVKRGSHLLFASTFSFTVAYLFAEEVLFLLTLPLSSKGEERVSLIFTTITEAFEAYILLALSITTGLFLLLVIGQIWAFIEPGLYREEKRRLKLVFFLSPLFFLFGLLLSYFFLLPLACDFLLSYEQKSHLSAIKIAFTPRVGEYLKVSLQLLIGGGFLFQYPLFLLGLVDLGLLQEKDMIRLRKTFILSAFLLGALLSPPDLLSQSMIAFPLLAFYEIVLCVLLYRRGDSYFSLESGKKSHT